MPDSSGDEQAPTTPEQDRRLVVFFCTWIAVSLVGNVVLLVLGRTDKLIGGFMMTAIGILALLCYAAYRRSRRASK